MTDIPFHPLLRRWFFERFSKPTAPQEQGWAHIADGRATLIAAPTGSGKTLAAFLWSINRLVERGLAGGLEDRTKDFIKRVVGLPGDTVEIRGKKVYVNGKAIDDPHAYFEGEGGGGIQIRDDYGPKKVTENHVFVMGDNRDKSYDSRFWGYVNLDDVKGKAFLIYWSWDGNDRWVRWERLGDIIY